MNHSLFEDHDDVLDVVVVEDVGDLLGQEPHRVLPVLGVGLVEELVEGVHVLPTLVVLVFYDPDDPLGHPLRQLSYLHVVVELDVADVHQPGEGQLRILGVGDELDVGLDHVEGDVLPDLHVDLLDVEVLEAEVDQEEVALQGHSVFVDVADDFHQDLIAVLLHEGDVELVALDPDRLQLVEGLLCVEELFLLTHQTDELQEDLHHEVALLDEGDCQSCANLSNCHVCAAVEQPVYRLPQQCVLPFQFLQVLLVVGVVNFDEGVGGVALDEVLVVLRGDELVQQVGIDEDEQHDVLGVGLAVLEAGGLAVEVGLDDLYSLRLGNLVQYFEGRGAEGEGGGGQVLVGVVYVILYQPIARVGPVLGLLPHQHGQPLHEQPAVAAHHLLQPAQHHLLLVEVPPVEVVHQLHQSLSLAPLPARPYLTDHSGHQ